MNKEMKMLIKEAILEALVEFTNGGIAMASEGDDETTGNTGDKNPGTGNGNGNGEGTSEGGENGEGDKKKDPLQPPIIFPPVGF